MHDIGHLMIFPNLLRNCKDGLAGGGGRGGVMVKRG